MPEAKQNERLQNPYPESVFPPMDLGPVSDYLIAGGYSPDRIFGNWGRQVWDNAVERARKEVGEWLVDKDMLEINDGVQYFLRGEMPSG